MTKIFLLVLSFFTISCASVIPPGGGPKDTEPAVMIQSNPKSGELNVKQKRLELIFDEEIDAPNLLNNLIITPYMEDNPYTPIIRKNRLILEFEKPLEENTTYVFNFAGSIRDITEGNITPNLIIPFSTGSIIDTGKISGKVTILETNKPAANYVVGLYAAGDSLTPKNSKPIYFTRTTSEGTYFIQNIKEDTFHLYTFDDVNKNLQWNDNEKIAFEKSVKPNLNGNVNLEAFSFDGKSPYLKSTKYFSDRTELNLSEGIKEYKLSNGELLSVLAESGQKITVYKSQQLTDTLKAPLVIIDSSGNKEELTAQLFFTEKDKSEINSGINISVEPPSLMIKPGEFETELIFNKPITESRTEKIYYYADSTQAKFTPDNFNWKNTRTLKINKGIIANDSIKLIIPQKSFISIDTFNQETSYTFTFLKEENFGTIRGRVQTEKNNYILQILNSKYEVLESIQEPLTFNFEYMAAGTYFLRVIIDTNNNQKWDQGNPFTFEKPESILFYPGQIDLRANWEISDINFTF